MLNEFLKVLISEEITRVLLEDGNQPNFPVPDLSMDSVASGSPEAAPADPGAVPPDMSGAPDPNELEPDSGETEKVENPKTVEDFIKNAQHYAESTFGNPVEIYKALRAEIQTSLSFNNKDNVMNLITKLKELGNDDITDAANRLETYLRVDLG